VVVVVVVVVLVAARASSAAFASSARRSGDIGVVDGVGQPVKAVVALQKKKNKNGFVRVFQKEGPKCALSNDQADFYLE